MSDELHYGIIKYNRRENTFIIINSTRTMIYDSRVGFLDLKALRLKDEIETEDINKLIAYMKPLMINATDRNTINHDNYQFYFNKLLTLSNIGGIIGWCLVISSYIYPDSIIKTVGAVAMGASNMLNRANTFVNVGYGEDLPNRFPDGRSHGFTYSQSDYTDMGKDYTDLRSSFANTQSDYTDSETWTKSYMGNYYTDLQSDYTDSETWTKSYPRSGFTDLKNSLVSGARKLVTPLEKLQEEYINEDVGILNRREESL